mgnify:CR=1 FL=1
MNEGDQKDPLGNPARCNFCSSWMNFEGVGALNDGLMIGLYDCPVCDKLYCCSGGKWLNYLNALYPKLPPDITRTKYWLINHGN